MHPVINRKLCKGCEACIDVCPNGLFEKVGGKIVVRGTHRCICCQDCVDVCENGAISLIQDPRENL